MARNALPKPQVYSADDHDDDEIVNENENKTFSNDHEVDGKRIYIRIMRMSVAIGGFFSCSYWC